MPSLQILRGLPGAGKSTYAASLPSAVICSADSYFLQADGTYVYDKTKIQLAHDACFKKALKAFEAHAPLVIIDNMNIESWEISPYVMLARAFEYEVEILNFHCDVELSHNRNIHGVPLPDIRRNAQKLKSAKFPKSWVVREMAC
jgi:predicted kinase